MTNLNSGPGSRPGSAAQPLAIELQGLHKSFGSVEAVKGINKPVVASLAGDVEVEEASEYLFDHKIPAYPYNTETPVAVLGAKYRWARGAGLL